MKKVFLIFAIVCMAVACGKSDESASSSSGGGGGGGDELRESFLGGCVKPLSKEIGQGKANKMCGCMYDKGVAKWGLGDFMKKAMEQGDDVSSLAMECVKNL